MHKDYYEEVVKKFEKGSIRIREQVKNVVELLDIKPGEIILEIGVGSGKYTSLVSRTNHVVGIDISDESVEVAARTVERNGIKENTSLVISMCEKLPFQEDMFDQTLMIDFVEHLSDESLESMLEDVRRVLKKSGKVVIYTPNRKHIFEYIRKPPKGHIGLRTASEIESKLLKHRYRVEKTYFRPSHFPVFMSIERLLMHLPIIGIYFKKRICMKASKKPR
jgi:ubiquinone/menaquinone biosynthesis C-methylase UbiE